MKAAEVEVNKAKETPIATGGGEEAPSHTLTPSEPAWVVVTRRGRLEIIA